MVKYPFELENRERVIGMKNIPVSSEDYDLVDRHTGEVKRMVMNMRQPIYLDGTEFVKIYDIDVLGKLNTNEWRVFVFVIGIMHYGGEFKFVYEECMGKMGMSRTCVYRGLKGLEKKNVVKKVDGFYYINWNIAFKGNREKINEKGL